MGGEILRLVEGVKPRWTICPSHLIDVYNPNSAETEYVSEEYGRRLDPLTLNSRIVGEEPDRQSFQLFCWAFFTCHREGWIDRDGLFIEGSDPPPVGRIAIPEPGGKVRICTKSPAALVTYG